MSSLLRSRRLVARYCPSAHRRKLTRNQIIAEATATAYKGASNDIQEKLGRVVKVWKDRNVFEAPILEAVRTRMNG